MLEVVNPKEISLLPFTYENVKFKGEREGRLGGGEATQKVPSPSGYSSFSGGLPTSGESHWTGVLDIAPPVCSFRFYCCVLNSPEVSVRRYSVFFFGIFPTSTVLKNYLVLSAERI